MVDRFTIFEDPQPASRHPDPRRFSVWEDDNSEDGRLIASKLVEFDAKRIATLLNVYGLVPKPARAQAGEGVAMRMTGGIGLILGWKIGMSEAAGWLLFNPEGYEVSPNLAPADVRDAFRAFVRERDRGPGCRP